MMAAGLNERGPLVIDLMFELSLVVFRPAMTEAAADPLYPFISPAPLLPEAVVTLTDVTCPDVVEEADELATGGGGGGRGEGGEQLEKM